MGRGSSRNVAGPGILVGVNLVVDVSHPKQAQIDALNDYMTAYEMLKYILIITGSSMDTLDEEINMWLRKIDIVEYSNVRINCYSGGTKRKLNTAMAMVRNY